MPMSKIQPITLSRLNAIIRQKLEASPELRSVWITAETSDVRAGHHCYLELIEKNETTGQVTAKSRAVIWAGDFARLSRQFEMQTGCSFTSHIKVMVCVTVTFHESYGMTLVITDIDSSYTMGDLLRRRGESILRLQAAGIYDLNRGVACTAVPQRIALVSSGSAAGYGDFVRQLLEKKTNPHCIRFEVTLFPSLMQGEQAPASITAALARIKERSADFDVVVIARGGGATSDFLAFESYDLADAVARFPLPVFTAVGHDRDVTLIDYVAHSYFKTPTAAGQWFVSRGESLLARLQRNASDMRHVLALRISDSREHLAYIAGLLPEASRAALMRSRRSLDRARMTLPALAERFIAPRRSMLGARATTLSDAVAYALSRARQRIGTSSRLLDALSPEATLRRGYSITRVNGHAVTSAGSIFPGQQIVTILADGQIISTITQCASGTVTDSNNNQSTNH